MTFEKVTSQPAFIRTNFTPEFPSDKRKLNNSPSLPKSGATIAYSRLTQDNSSSRRVLNRALSDNTFLTRSSLTGVSDKTWGSTILPPYSTDRKHPPKVSYRPANELKPLTSPHHHPQKPDSHVRDRSFKKDSISEQHTDSSLNRKVSAQTERASKENHDRIAPSKNATCHRENPVIPSPPMPKSSGQSSRSSLAKRSEKKEPINADGRSLNPAAEDQPSPTKRRPHSADERQKETTTCSFFSFIRKKKKVSRSPSPDAQGKKSNRHNSRSRSIISCSSAQSKPTSDRVFSPSDKDRRLSAHSLTSSRIPQHSISSTQPPSVLSPSATTPLLPPTPPANANKGKQYTSRSRSKNRRDRRHRTSKRAFKVHPDDRLRHEDLPPHPSICKSTVVRGSSEPATSHTKPVVHTNNTNNSNSNNSNSNNIPNNSNNINSYNVHFSLDINSQPRKNSKPESSLNAKSAAVSSASGGNRKDSTTGESAFNLKDKSQHSASKTDLEEDSHCQFTTSSSDQISRRSFRSQSLPSFRGGERFQQDADIKVISDAEDFEYCPTDMQGPLHLSLCGCGFLGMYHLGVVSCLAMRGLPFLDRVEKVAGASAGALMAAVLITARDKIEESAEHVQNLAKEIRRKPLGALTPGYSFTRSLRHMLNDILPEDAHEAAKGKLFVSLTNADTKKNEMLSDFRSRDELIEALIASCYIPVYAGIKLPTVRGKKYIDGGLSDNLPRFETGRTITVSPFDGKSDIGPKKGQEAEKKAHFISVHNQDIQVTMNNLKKGTHAFFPPKRQTLQEYFEKGRYDASRFLIKEGLYEINNQPHTKTVLYESSV